MTVGPEKSALIYDLIRSLRSPDAVAWTDSAIDRQTGVDDFNRYGRNSPGPVRPALAAVLIPLVERRTGSTVLLMQRTENLPNHSGQFSFPGGKAEPGDKNPVETALRETREEIGLYEKYIKIVGLLDDYETVTGFRITPVVGTVTDGFNLALDSREVAGVFEVPLVFIVNPLNHQICTRTVNGIEGRYFVFEYKTHYIWGATAGMLMNLYQHLIKTDNQCSGVPINP